LVFSIKHANPDTNFGEALGSGLKGEISLLTYVFGTGLAFVNPIIAYSLYVLVSIMWFIPDKRLAHIKHE